MPCKASGEATEKCRTAGRIRRNRGGRHVRHRTLRTRCESGLVLGSLRRGSDSAAATRPYASRINRVRQDRQSPKKSKNNSPLAHPAGCSALCGIKPGRPRRSVAIVGAPSNSPCAGPWLRLHSRRAPSAGRFGHILAHPHPSDRSKARCAAPAEPRISRGTSAGIRGSASLRTRLGSLLRGDRHPVCNNNPQLL